MDTPHNASEQKQGTPNSTPATTPHPSSDKVLMSILSYLGPLVIIAYIMKKDNPFVKFHIKQGLVLLSIEVILWVLSTTLLFWSLWPIYRILHLCLMVLSVIGIINVVQEKEKELPLVGSFSKYFPV